LKSSLLIFLVGLPFLNCNNQADENERVYVDSSIVDTSANGYQHLEEKEQSSIESTTDTLGQLISEIDFHVKTNNITDYKEGFIPYITVEKPGAEIKNLIGGDEVVISENRITIIIDYPLNNPYTFNLVSEKGFTKETLIKEISKHYHRIYDEEENTSTIKTIPVGKRTKIYNRNQTNGKYGIWGHDLADLVLAGILVYKTADEQIILRLEMES
jgi:hypothetical protein